MQASIEIFAHGLIRLCFFICNQRKQYTNTQCVIIDAAASRGSLVVSVAARHLGKGDIRM